LKNRNFVKMSWILFEANVRHIAIKFARFHITKLQNLSTNESTHAPVNMVLFWANCTTGWVGPAPHERASPRKPVSNGSDELALRYILCTQTLDHIALLNYKQITTLWTRTYIRIVIRSDSITRLREKTNDANG